MKLADMFMSQFFPKTLTREKLSAGLVWLPSAFLKHIKTHWLTWILLVSTFWLFKTNYIFGFNASPSLPNKYFITHINEVPKKEDYITFRFYCAEGVDCKGTRIFTKIAKGIEGDLITRDGLKFFINDKHIATAKTVGSSGRPVKFNAIGPEGYRLKKGEFFVWSPHEFSFDSRYELVGIVRGDAVMGRAYAIF